MSFGDRHTRIGVLATTLTTLCLSGCISDSDCGVCDPDNLVLQSMTGVNYANRRVHVLADGVTRAKYFIDDIGACELTDEAMAAPRGPEEWCKLSPLMTWQGLAFVFNNLLDPTTIELVRKNPANPRLFQIYDWKTQFAQIEGPITRFNGDYLPQPKEAPDLMLRATNLSCIDNLRTQGINYDHATLDANPDICEGFHEVDGRKLPLKMQASGVTKSFRGETDWRAMSCTAADSGPDTCCTVCDYELSVNVAKYGADSSGSRLRPANAIACDPGGNVYEDCAGFITQVDREAETNRYSYSWDGTIDTFRLPLYDKVRETHPDDRPPGVEPDGPACQTSADCDAQLGGNSGAVCMGRTAAGVTCDSDTEGCADLHCKAQWFVTCKDDGANTGGAYCTDRRFKDKGAGACFVATTGFQACQPSADPNVPPTCASWAAGNRLARCDVGEYPDGQLAASECCQTALGADQDGAGCDPLFQPNVVPIPRFDRDRSLPDETRDCFCGDPAGQHPACAKQIESWCTPPWGQLQRHDGSSNDGDYVTRFVSRTGGVFYDPALKGVQYLPADRGNQPRSLVESCAELPAHPQPLDGRSMQDGWRMHDNSEFETYENFDRGMCSGSEYRVVFASEGERVVDRVGNQLPAGATYAFQTPEFHVVPGTGFPTDNLRVGACDEFELSVSNKYDLDPNNLAKLQLVQLSQISGEDAYGESCETSLQPECWKEDHVVAGGSECADEREDVTVDHPPCLSVDVALQREGLIRVVIDSVRFGRQLSNYSEDDPQAGDAFGRAYTGRYRMKLPGLEQVERFEDLDLDDPADLAAYERAFKDVCGMPLITTGGQGYTDFYYDFTIDAPKCKEDPDRDDVQLSCDNAPDHPNPDQRDQDFDGFGDVVDLCPLTPSGLNTADSDGDGVGNDCDTCRQRPDKYNFDAALPDDVHLWVRNIPHQLDFDHDGIGDVCDNCVTQANCGGFDESNPHRVGVPVPFQSPSMCQGDVDSNMIGDACVDPDTHMPFVDLDNAAGPVGFLATDDFDQDGINNFDDSCPRQPVEQDLAQRSVCTTDDDCPREHSACAATPALNGLRYCDHVDLDGDGAGDICDSCPAKSNPLQLTDSGLQADDEDGDFVGSLCEPGDGCDLRNNPRPLAFMEVAVQGQCCVTTYPGDGWYEQRPDGSWGCEGLCDPDGFPITVDCANEAALDEDMPDGSKCRKLPAVVTLLPGVVTLPSGCEAALASAGLCDGNDPSCDPDLGNRWLTTFDYPDEDQLWSKMCFLPQWDQDFDGLGDACDLCEFAFDPFNQPLTDKFGKLWPNVGHYCSGEYSADAVCALQDELDGVEETETGGETAGETG
ncbi:thrombospondin type 3 repeat-containing protein [Enhygromyxa salina]|uniref:Uncharacterized protein n=1 Tax=Enhygromyxa salina TaxID=215803 RepID=A0A2S9YV10_9BACT|nr:thrombospondin type 3 repeat-containing protein [Enhygromyxa salina]PRQ08924.1 hypothetical protein ENSA7_13230 [Enhygromyxa salina]